MSTLGLNRLLAHLLSSRCLHVFVVCFSCFAATPILSRLYINLVIHQFFFMIVEKIDGQQICPEQNSSNCYLHCALLVQQRVVFWFHVERWGCLALMYVTTGLVGVCVCVCVCECLIRVRESSPFAWHYTPLSFVWWEIEQCLWHLCYYLLCLVTATPNCFTQVSRNI